MAKELIESLFDLEEETKRFRVIEEVDEKTGASRMRIQGVCQRADHVNLNNRLYPKKVLESSVGRLRERISQGRGFGELDHPTQTASLKNTAHLINDVWWDKKDPSLLCCDVTILDTPHGQVLKEIVRAGGRPGFSSRGNGEVERVKLGEKEVDQVQDGFDLASFDFVIDPSVQSAQIRAVMESAVKKYVTEGEMNIKTVDDLRKFFPDLVKEIEEKVIEDAEKVVAQELEEKNKQLADELARLKVEADAVNAQAAEQGDNVERYISFMNELVDLLIEYGVLGPEEVEPEIPAEEPEGGPGESTSKEELMDKDKVSEENENLKKVVTSLEEENKALKAKVEEHDKAKAEAEAEAKKSAELAEAETKKATELEEQKKVAQYVEEKLKGHKLAAMMKPRLEGLKTVEEVDKKLAEDEALVKFTEENFGGRLPTPKGRTGELTEDDEAKKGIRESAKRLAGITTPKKK